MRSGSPRSAIIRASYSAGFFIRHFTRSPSSSAIGWPISAVKSTPIVRPAAGLARASRPSTSLKRTPRSVAAMTPCRSWVARRACSVSRRTLSTAATFGASSSSSSRCGSPTGSSRPTSVTAPTASPSASRGTATALASSSSARAASARPPPSVAGSARPRRATSTGTPSRMAAAASPIGSVRSRGSSAPSERAWGVGPTA